LVKKNRQFWTGDEETKVRDFAKKEVKKTIRQFQSMGDEILHDKKYAVRKQIARLKVSKFIYMCACPIEKKNITKAVRIKTMANIKRAPTKFKEGFQKAKDGFDKAKDIYQHRQIFNDIYKNTPQADGLDDIHVRSFLRDK
jgi:hypothetical protein